MPEAFFALSADDRKEALALAADRSGRPAHLLEKDAWVVWALSTVYSAPLAEHLVFKGGTSLSKAYGVIRRFSEDVDLTYDIRELIPDLVGENADAVPTTRAEMRRWAREVGRRLPEWVVNTAQPIVVDALEQQFLAAKVRIEGEKLFINYEAAFTGSGYVSPSVMLEFGARSTGEPASVQEIICDAEGFVGDLVFPAARPRVMHAERTFWEKATAAHVFCLQARMRGERFARHWHDLVRLDETGFAAKAIADRTLANSVAQHKSMFFRETAPDGAEIDYAAAVNGELRLVPEGDSAKALKEDYVRMVDDGLLLDDAEAFEKLMERCSDISARGNKAAEQA
jgi:hypothetical protein